MSNEFVPARIDMEQAARILGFPLAALSVLVSKGKLQPLGKPANNAPKFFARCEIEAKAKQVEWLSDATKTVSREWKKRNDARKGKRRSDGTNLN